MTPLDQPEDEHAMELAVPFVICQSQGGPYDDDAFVAGFQCGEIDRALLAAADLCNVIHVVWHDLARSTGTEAQP